MATSKIAKIEYESGQTLNDYAAMTDSGDHKVHTISDGDIWSGKDDFTPDVRPNGVVSGRNLLSTHATNDTVTIAGFTAYSEGTLHTVAATTDTITRPAGDVAKINSITMTDAGAIAVIAGTDSATTAFDDTGRGGAGQPPYIPADSVEIGQIRVTTQAAAAISSDEIFQVVGQHTERYDYPTWTENNIGDGTLAEASAKQNAYIEFASALPAIHTGDAYKQVYIKYYEPIFAELPKGLDFTPSENTHSVNSSQYYNGTIASTSTTLGQGSFTGLMDDNVTDGLLAVRDEIITIRFYPNRNKSPYVLTQGLLGMARTYPVDDQNSVTVTISSENKSADFDS